MRRTVLLAVAGIAALCLGVGIVSCMPKKQVRPQADEVVELVRKVNRHWQEANPGHDRAFRDNAAYHTGNMEACFFTGDTDYYNFSEAWTIRANAALQPDGSIGYVQPVGESAIPGQTVNAQLVTPFGTGAFLLAACEMARYCRDESDEAIN